MFKTWKKGVTIAEMIVALAVVSVVSTIVLSFCVLVNARSVVATAKLEALQDMEMVESVCESWVSSIRSDDKSLKLVNNQLVTESDAGTLTWNATTQTLSATFASRTQTVVSNRIKRVIFDLKTNSDNDVLLFVTVSYSIPKAEDTNTFDILTKTFCVAPHVGDII